MSFDELFVLFEEKEDTCFFGLKLYKEAFISWLRYYIIFGKSCSNITMTISEDNKSISSFMGCIFHEIRFLLIVYFVSSGKTTTFAAQTARTGLSKRVHFSISANCEPRHFT